MMSLRALKWARTWVRMAQLECMLGRALVMKTTVSLADIVEVVARDAIRCILLSVATSYHLDYAVLKDAYEDVVVQRTCGKMHETGDDMCKGTTQKGKPCSFRAVYDGYCGKHAKEGDRAREEEARRQSYMEKRKRAPRDPHLEEVCARGKRRLVSVQHACDDRVLRDMNLRAMLRRVGRSRSAT